MERADRAKLKYRRDELMAKQADLAREITAYANAMCDEAATIADYPESVVFENAPAPFDSMPRLSVSALSGPPPPPATADWPLLDREPLGHLIVEMHKIVTEIDALNVKLSPQG